MSSINEFYVKTPNLDALNGKEVSENLKIKKVSRKPNQSARSNDKETATWNLLHHEKLLLTKIQTVN